MWNPGPPIVSSSLSESLTTPSFASSLSLTTPSFDTTDSLTTQTPTCFDYTTDSTVSVGDTKADSFCPQITKMCSAEGWDFVRKAN